MGLTFAVIAAPITEHEAADAEPRAMVLHNAALKADWVAERHPEAVVLGADTTVFIDHTVLNKPADLTAARAMLKQLSGRTHTVFTGVSVRHRVRGFKHDEGVASQVTFKVLTDEVIDRYFAQINPLDKAGGYGIQSGADLIVAGYEGSLTNIVGLPVEATKQILTRCGLFG